MVKHVYQSTKGYRITISLLLCGLIVAMLTEAQFDRIIGKIIDTLFYFKSFEFIKVLIVYFIYFAVNQIAYLVMNMIWMRLRNTYLLSIRKRCFNHLLDLRVERIQQMKSGEFNKIVQEDVECYLEYIYRVVFYVIGNFVFLLYALFYILKTNLGMGALTIALLPFIYWGNKKIKDSIKTENSSLQEERASANIWITEKIYGIREIILLRANTIIGDEYRKVNERYNKKNIQISNTLFWNQKIIDFILLVGQLLLFYLGVTLFVEGKITIGSLVATIGYYLTCKGLMASMYVKVTNGFTTMTGVERVYNFLHLEAREERKGIFDEVEEGSIRFENVSFSYGEKQILYCVNVDIKQGDNIAIVGDNGSGKSTFMKLCYGLISSDSGNILLGNKSITDYTYDAMIKSIGVVQQNPVIYKNTFGFNIALENEIDEEWMSLIIEELGLAYLINDTFNFDSLIGLGGRELSGGECQRIAIARGIYRKPKILFLDEFTSALDNLSADKVEKAIERLLPECTCIYISHLNEQIAKSDYIYRVEGGELIKYEG